MKIKTGLVMVLGAVSLTTCGKSVMYSTVEPEVPGTVYCLVNCETYGNDVTSPLVELEFSVPYSSHDQLICSDFRLHSSIGRTSAGCNDGLTQSVTVTSKLRNTGDCQRLTIWSEVTNPGPFNTNNGLGHYEFCRESGPTIWADVEDHAKPGVPGQPDFNDAKLEVRAVNGEVLSWEFDNGKLFICKE